MKGKIVITSILAALCLSESVLAGSTTCANGAVTVKIDHELGPRNTDIVHIKLENDLELSFLGQFLTIDSSYGRCFNYSVKETKLYNSIEFGRLLLTTTYGGQGTRCDLEPKTFANLHLEIEGQIISEQLHCDNSIGLNINFLGQVIEVEPLPGQ